MDSKKLCVLYDGSESSVSVLNWILDFARSDAKIILLHAFEKVRAVGVIGSKPDDVFLSEYGRMASEIDKKREGGALADLEKATLILGQGHLALDRIQKVALPVENGDDVRDAILAWVEKHHIDMIIVGNRGRGALKRILLGSMSSYLVHHASVPVTVVRAPKDDVAK